MTIKEIRGIWLTDTDSKVLRSQANIATAMDLLAETGFNVVFPVVWKGVPLYPSTVMRQNFGVEIHSPYAGRDPLAEIITEARRVGLKVIPWFEYGFVSAYNANGGLILQKKPQWSAYDYNGNLLTKNGFDWMNALNLEVQDFMLKLILEVVNNYDVDGIQGDDRIPAFPSEGGYDPQTRECYRQQLGNYPPKNYKDRQWLQWRADILTAFLARLYSEVKAINSKLLVSMTPNIYSWGYQEYLQDYPTWLKRGIVDMIHPQIYRRDFQSYKNIIDQLLSEQFTPAQLSRLAPGVLMKLGSYYINPNLMLEIINYNRANGISGEVFFFYEGLPHHNNNLAQVLRTGAYAQDAAFPTLSDLCRVSDRLPNSLPSWRRWLNKIGLNF